MKNSIKRNSNINCFALILVALLFVTSTHSQTITVNSTDYQQTIDMIGGDMERSSKAVQNASNTDSIIKWGFGDIEFNTCRVQFDKNQELEEGTKDWSFYDKQVATMQGVKAVNPDIQFFATLRTDYDGYGDANNLPDWICDYDNKDIDEQKYGIFLADYVEYMEQQGVPIAIMSTLKEWYWFLKADEADGVITTLKSELNERGVAMPLICDQGAWSITQGIKYIDGVTELGTEDLYWGFCSHNYDDEDVSQWESIISKANALGKNLYNDEMSSGSGGATSGVDPAITSPIRRYIERAEMYGAGLSGDIFFEIWSRGIDTETRSIYYPSGGEGNRIRGYYIMKQFSNNILDSRYITSSIYSMDTESVYTMAFRKDNKITLWVMNYSSTDLSSVPITIESSTIDGSIAVHYWTNDTPNEGTTTTYSSSGNSFNVTIEGLSINSYIFTVTSDSGFDAFSQIEAENYTAMSGIKTEDCDEGGEDVGYIDDGDWILFEDIDFDNGAESVDIRVASQSTGGTIEFRLGSTSGTLIGTASVPVTSDWQIWETVSYDISGATDVQDLYLVFTEGGINVNWFEFTATPNSNLALNGSASQSSTTNSALASRAIDGNTSGVWSDGSVTHTDNEENAWWELELDGTYNIGAINIYGRTDCCADRLDNFTVSVINASGSTTFSQSYTTYPNPLTTLDAYGASGNTIRIQLDDTERLSLAEVEVYESDLSCATFSTIQAEDFDNMSGIVDEGENIGFIEDGDWAMYSNIDLNCASSFSASTSSTSNGGDIEVRLGSTSGELIGTLEIAGTGSWNTWETSSLNLSNVSGSQDIYLVFSGDSGYLFNIDWLEFSTSTKSAVSNDFSSVEQENIINIYPNPVNDVLTIDLSDSQNAQLEIFNNAGQVLLSENIEEVSSTFDMSMFKTGVFIVKVTDEHQVKITKIIKM